MHGDEDLDQPSQAHLATLGPKVAEIDERELKLAPHSRI
jgi:hypothetical protein